MGKATVPLQGSEGKLRYWHLRIRDYAESICFYKGKRTEASRVNALLEEVYAGRLKQLKAYVRGARKRRGSCERSWTYVSLLGTCELTPTPATGVGVTGPTPLAHAYSG